MAVRPVTWTDVSLGRLFSWASLTGSDTGTPLECADFGDKTVEVVGTFTGDTVVLEGSNAGDTYYTLTDHKGDPISFTSAGIRLVAERPRYIRPRASGGTGNLACHVMAGRSIR